MSREEGGWRALSANPGPRATATRGRLSLSLYRGALLLGVESGSRPPTLDFERYPFSFYYLPSLHLALARRRWKTTAPVRETLILSTFHAEHAALPRSIRIMLPLSD